MNADLDLTVLGGSAGTTPGALPWPPAPRAPLAAWPPITSARHGAQVWASASYRQEIAYPLPSTPDKRFYRGNFSGIRVPGAPAVKDGKNATVPGADTSFIYSSHLPRYPLEWQHEICRQYAARGYSHFFLMLGNTIGEGEDRAGLSLQQFIDAVHVAQHYGLWADVAIIGGGPVLGPRDATWDYYKPIYTPLVDELFAQHAIDTACVGMQLDLWNSPYGLRTIVEGLGALIKAHDPTMPVASHWANHACAWYGKDQNGDSGFHDRFEYWNYWHQTGLMDWAYFQQDTGAPLDDTEGRLAELMKTCDVVGFELTAQAQFDAAWTADKVEVTEDSGDLVGLAGLCTTGGPYRVAGYGNGGRRHDGTGA